MLSLHCLLSGSLCSKARALTRTARRQMTLITFLNTRIPTRLALLAHLAALARRRTLALRRLAEGIQSL
jgi:hypothetical protein